MASSALEILDLLISIEKAMWRLYLDYAMQFHSEPEHYAFWQNIAMEEVEHASFLESENQIISAISELQFIQFVNPQKLEEVFAEIQQKRTEFDHTPYPHQQAIQVARGLEMGYNEHLLRHSIKTEFPQIRNIIETLGSMNEKHIQLLTQAV
ncbi:MAG: hypothetical protein ACE14V_04215 [bacterium]